MDSSCFLLATLVSSAWDIPVRLYNKGKAESEPHLRTLIGDISSITHKGAAPMNVAEHIISLERSALDRWVRGDPDMLVKVKPHGPAYVLFNNLPRVSDAKGFLRLLAN